MWTAHRHLKLKTAVLPALAYALPVIQTSTDAVIFSDEVLHVLRLLPPCLPQTAPPVFGRANASVSKLSCCESCVNTSGNFSLGFSRDHTGLVGLFRDHCNTLFENRVGEGDPCLLHRDTYSVGPEVRFLFSTTHLTTVPCSALRKREMREAFVPQLLWCIEGCGSQRWSPSW